MDLSVYLSMIIMMISINDLSMIYQFSINSQKKIHKKIHDVPMTCCLVIPIPPVVRSYLPQTCHGRHSGRHSLQSSKVQTVATRFSLAETTQFPAKASKKASGGSQRPGIIGQILDYYGLFHDRYPILDRYQISHDRLNLIDYSWRIHRSSGIMKQQVMGDHGFFVMEISWRIVNDH